MSQIDLSQVEAEATAIYSRATQMLDKKHGDEFSQKNPRLVASVIHLFTAVYASKAKIIESN